MGKKTNPNNADSQTLCGIGKHIRTYTTPSIEVTYVQYEGNLLAGSGLRVISKPYVEDWEEKEESTDVWMGY